MKENFLRFMTSPKGRVGRVIMGLVMIALGMFVVQGLAGSILAAVALIPIAGGLFDFCLVGFLLGYPLSGVKARQILAAK